MNKIKRKKTCSLCFVKVFKCREIIPGNKNNNKKRRFLGNATGHNDHYMISMGGQMPKIGGN